MNITIDTNTISNTELLTPQEVAEQLWSLDAIHLENDEKLGRVTFENGDLSVEIERKIDGDPRCSGYTVRTDTFALTDICEYFVSSPYYAWCKGEDGNDYLACFGC